MRQRKWTKNQLIQSVKNSFSIRQVLQKIKLKETGGNYKQIYKYLKEYNCNIGHFKGRGWNAGLHGIGKNRYLLSEILVKNSNFQSHKLKIRLFKEGIKPKKCEQCGWAKITIDGYLPLELDHINGNNKDNRLENLRILCPNCHSLTNNHRGRKNSKKKIK